MPSMMLYHFQIEPILRCHRYVRPASTFGVFLFARVAAQSSTFNISCSTPSTLQPRSQKILPAIPWYGPQCRDAKRGRVSTSCVLPKNKPSNAQITNRSHPNRQKSTFHQNPLLLPILVAVMSHLRSPAAPFSDTFF